MKQTNTNALIGYLDVCGEISCKVIFYFLVGTLGRLVFGLKADWGLIYSVIMLLTLTVLTIAFIQTLILKFINEVSFNNAICPGKNRWILYEPSHGIPNLKGRKIRVWLRNGWISPWREKAGSWEDNGDLTINFYQQAYLTKKQMKKENLRIFFDNPKNFVNNVFNPQSNLDKIEAK